MSEQKCINCGSGTHFMPSGLCTVCHLAVAGTVITGQTKEEALAMMREIVADKRAQPFTDTMRRAVENLYD